MKLAIHTDTLKALLLFAAKADIRFYLNGLLIETGPLGTRAVATDGCTMAAASLPMLGAEAATLIVPRDALEAAIKAVGKGPVVSLEFAAGERNPDHPRAVTIEAGQASIKATELDGVFPQWRRVIPAKCSGELAQFDPEYLQAVRKAQLLIQGKRAKHLGIAHNGQAAALARIGADFLAVVMPLRDLQPEGEAPSWVSEPLTASAEETATA